MCPLVRPLVAVLACVASVAAAAEPTTGGTVIDTQGIVFGVPFGTSEDGVRQKFGPPAGYLHLDAHRTALLYGQSYLLLCYDGSFDGVRINRSAVDWELSRWLVESAPFLSEGWRMSNGMRPEMTLKAAKELVKAEPTEHRYHLSFSTEACHVELSFSHYTSEGDGDEAYKIIGVLMASTHDGKDHWSEPPMTVRSFGASMSGKKIIGMRLGESVKGVRVTAVYQGSPADLAGIRVGDLLTGLNGENAIGMAATEFSRRIADAQDPSAVEVTTKDGAKRTVSLSHVDGGSLSGTMSGPGLMVSEVNPGDAAPDFMARTTDGAMVELSAWQGAPVLVNFTATWCPPCKAETAALATTYAKYKAQGLKIVSVYLDEPGKDVFAYAKTLGAEWPINTDGKLWDNAVARTYGVAGIPSNVLVGRDGKILAIDARGAQLDPLVEAALK